MVIHSRSLLAKTALVGSDKSREKCFRVEEKLINSRFDATEEVLLDFLFFRVKMAFFTVASTSDMTSSHVSTNSWDKASAMGLEGPAR